MIKTKKYRIWIILVAVFTVFVIAIGVYRYSIPYHQRIKVNSMLYEQVDESMTKLPEEAVEIGRVEWVKRKERKNPRDNFTAININWRFEDNKVYENSESTDTIYIEGYEGGYVPFIRVYDDITGFDMRDKEITHLLGYTHLSSFSVYEMDGGLYLIGFYAGNDDKKSDMGVVIFQFTDGQYELLNQKIYENKSREVEHITQCTLSIPDGSYYDIILSNNENIEEIHMEYESELYKTKLNEMNPYMTVFSFPEEPGSRVFTIYDSFGQQMDSSELEVSNLN